MVLCCMRLRPNRLEASLFPNTRAPRRSIISSALLMPACHNDTLYCTTNDFAKPTTMCSVSRNQILDLMRPKMLARKCSGNNISLTFISCLSRYRARSIQRPVRSHSKNSSFLDILCNVQNLCRTCIRNICLSSCTVCPVSTLVTVTERSFSYPSRDRSVTWKNPLAWLYYLSRKEFYRFSVCCGATALCVE